MPYAGMQRGNYAAGDYYSYQAGGIFGSIGKVLGGVAKVVGKVAPGPIGSVASGIGKVLAPSRGTALIPAPMTLPTFGSPFGPAQVPKTAPGAMPVPGIVGIGQRLVPGGASGYQQAGGPGWHLNKQDGKYGAAGTYYVRNRAMNPGNARALRRAIRREKSFVALAKRVLRGTGITVGRRSFARKTSRARAK